MSVPDRKFDRCSDPFDGIGVVGLGGIGVTDGETMSFPFAPLDTLIGHISNESYESNSKSFAVSRVPRREAALVIELHPLALDSHIDDRLSFLTVKTQQQRDIECSRKDKKRNKGGIHSNTPITKKKRVINTNASTATA
jgi:hypothetical protein